MTPYLTISAMAPCNTNSFDGALVALVNDINAMHQADALKNNTPEKNVKRVIVERARKFIKLWIALPYEIERNERGSILLFIDPVTGYIYKPASYKAPAKGVRGNIFTYKSVNEFCSIYGANRAR